MDLANRAALWLTIVALADIIRPESKRAVSLLKEMGIQRMMLTGDRREVARWVSEEIGLDEYFAQVLPSTVIVAINARFLRIRK